MQGLTALATWLAWFALVLVTLRWLALRRALRLAARRRDVMSTRLGHAVTAARKHMRSARTYRELYWHAHGQVTEARRLTLALKEAVMPGRTIAATAPDGPPRQYVMPDPSDWRAAIYSDTPTRE